MTRRINTYFPQSPIDKIGDSYNRLVKSSSKLTQWTAGNIFRSASSFKPKDGPPPPYILNMILQMGSRLYPGQKERQTIKCGSLIVYEEPFEEIKDGDSTIASVADELKRVIYSDPFLKLPDNSLKTEKVHAFELMLFEGKEQEDSVLLYVGYRVEYILDVNYLSRAKM